MVRWYSVSGLRNQLAVASGIGCCLLLVVLVVSYRLDMETQGIEITSRFHVGFFDGYVWFYSEKWPYHGSSIWFPEGRVLNDICWHVGDYGIRRETFADEQGNAVETNTGCDLPGIYYRRFGWVLGDPLWTLAASLWFPIVLLAVLPILRAICLVRSRLRCAAGVVSNDLAEQDVGQTELTSTPRTRQ
jgi:hypothetical protein